MPFKNKKQQAAVMLMMKQLRRGMTLYHAGSPPRKLKVGDVLHVGTRAAAEERARDIAEGDWTGGAGGEALKMYKVRIKARKPLLTHGKIFDESGYDRAGRSEGDRLDELFGQGEWSGEPYGLPKSTIAYNRSVIRRLNRRGFDVIPYVNQSEDRGSVSFALIHPRTIASMKMLAHRGVFRPPRHRR